jgi:hypothetical protein
MIRVTLETKRGAPGRINNAGRSMTAGEMLTGEREIEITTYCVGTRSLRPVTHTVKQFFSLFSLAIN